MEGDEDKPRFRHSWEFYLHRNLATLLSGAGAGQAA